SPAVPSRPRRTLTGALAAAAAVAVGAALLAGAAVPAVGAAAGAGGAAAGAWPLGAVEGLAVQPSASATISTSSAARRPPGCHLSGRIGLLLEPQGHARLLGPELGVAVRAAAVGLLDGQELGPHVELPLAARTGQVDDPGHGLTPTARAGSPPAWRARCTPRGRCGPARRPAPTGGARTASA